MDGVAAAVAEHLDFDVAGTREMFLQIERVVTERGLGFGARGRDAVASSSGICATFMPRPPPPAAAFTRTGKPIACAIDIASWSEEMAPSDPGTTGMPRRLAVRLASILSPIRRICSGLGPMKWTSCSARISAKRAFSDRKP